MIQFREKSLLISYPDVLVSLVYWSDLWAFGQVHIKSRFDLSENRTTKVDSNDDRKKHLLTHADYFSKKKIYLSDGLYKVNTKNM